MNTYEEQFTRQFYDWEQRGRGWQLYAAPVRLEPPFRPLYFVAPPPQVYDDGRKHSFWSSLWNDLRGDSSAALQKANQSEPNQLDCSTFEPEIEYYSNEDETVCELQISLPQDSKVTSAVAEQLLLSLSCTTGPVSFEVIGTRQAIWIQFACVKKDLVQVRQQLAAFLPDAVITEKHRSLETAWNAAGRHFVTVDFGLSNEFMLPLRSITAFEPDPLIAVAGALSNLKENEIGVLQILFQAAQEAWADEMINSVRCFDGSPFFANAPEMIPLTKEKISRPLFAAVIRVAARSDSLERAWQTGRSLGGALKVLANPAGNELIPLSNDDYSPLDHEESLLFRHSYRTGMILNSAELVSLVHPPSQNVRLSKLIRNEALTKAAPALSLGQRTVLGENIHHGEVRAVGLSTEQRTKHLHLIGASGSGKSTLLLNLIRQDMEQGEGVAVFDPHGDLIDDVLRFVPASRIKDVILFDPSDAEYPVGFNPLEARSEAEKTLLASDLIATFRRFSTSWGDVMDSVLANAVLAVLESKQGGTLFDLKRLLVEKEFRAEFLRTVEDSAIRYFWEKEYPAVAGRSQSSVLIRLDTFLRQKIIRNIVCQKETKIDFRQIMDERKILLVKLSQGSIGAENSYLLGTLLVSKLYQTALSRQDAVREMRPFFGIYLDEFHHFIAPSMANILSGVRKYNLGLALAHQEFRQLSSRDTDVAQSVLSNCYTRICFRLGDADAERFAGGFGFFDARHLQNLGVGEAIGRIERAEFDFNLKTVLAPVVENADARRKQAATVQQTREQYAVPRAAIEAALHTTNLSDSSATSLIAENDAITTALKSSVAKTSGENSATKKTKTTERQNGAGGTEVSGQFEDRSASHSYLQSLVKRIAERRGFLATIEKPVFGGIGKVDVALEREEIKLACEISVSNTTEYELANLQKCLAAGFDQVVMISPDEKHLVAIKQKAEAGLSVEQYEKVVFLSPEGFHQFLENYASDSPESTKRVKGYQVETSYKENNGKKEGSRLQSMKSILGNAMKRLQGK